MKTTSFTQIVTREFSSAPQKVTKKSQARHPKALFYPKPFYPKPFIMNNLDQYSDPSLASRRVSLDMSQHGGAAPMHPGVGHKGTTVRLPLKDTTMALLPTPWRRFSPSLPLDTEAAHLVPVCPLPAGSLPPASTRAKILSHPPCRALTCPAPCTCPWLRICAGARSWVA